MTSRLTCLPAFAALALLASCAGAQSTSSPSVSIPPDVSKRVVLGAAMTKEQLRDPEMIGLVKGTFTSLTPDNQMKWGILQPERGQFDFSSADEMMAIAKQNDMRVRGHALMWYPVPDWVKEQATTCDAAKDILKTHITTVVTHFKGQVPEWDVVNEPLDENGNLREEDPFLKACGESIIDDAFIWAHAADPDAVLYLNDYSTLVPDAKARGQYALVKRLVERKVPIDAVGFQGHEKIDSLDDGAAENVQAHADLGLKVALTEVDVRLEKKGDAPTEEQVAQQASTYRQLAMLCAVNRSCIGFTVWSVSDRTEWVRKQTEGFDFQGMADQDLVHRPAWDAVVKTLRP